MVVNINPKLSEAAAFNPTKQSQTKSVFDMCQDIEKGAITLPLYQRDLSWNDNKAIALFNYEMFGKAPVAPISMNKIGSSNEIPQISFIDRERIPLEDTLGNLSIVDGQQRLTTNYKAYSDDPTFSKIVLDVTQARFKAIKHNPHDNQIPVGVLLNKDQRKLRDYLAANSTLDSMYPPLLEVRSKMSNYNYTVHIADDLNEDEQIEWFDVLNTAGSRVTGIQLAFSKLKLHDFDIYTDYSKPFKEKLVEYGLEELFTPFSTSVSYPIASLNPAYEVLFRGGVHKSNYAPIPSDTREKVLVKLSKENLNRIGNLTLTGLNTALKFVFDHHFLTLVSKKIDYVLYLTGYFVFNNNDFDSISEDKLIEWTKNVVFEDNTNKERREIFSNLLNL